MDEVILVDTEDREVGVMEKLEAHRRGILHRAFSVFIFRADGVLLQRRALGKYHSAGLWSNTCCSHPRPGESVAEAARRRLREEMGLTCELSPAGGFVYRTEFPGGLIEHEHDHVLIGHSEVEPVSNPEEVLEWKWMGIVSLKEDLLEHPERYTYWLPQALELALAGVRQ